MKLCIAGPIATEDVAHLLTDGGRDMPVGYVGAPLTAVLIEELLRQGHEISAITTDSSLPMQRLGWATAEGPGFKLCICPARPRAWRFNGALPGRALDFWRWERREIADAMLASGADLLHAHWTYEFALAALTTKLPTLVTCHDSPKAVLRYTRSPYRALRYLMARNVLQRADNLTAVSSYMAEQVHTLANAAIEVVPNPIANDAVRLGRERPAPTGKANVAMVCNGWGPLKNVEMAFRAFRLLLERLPHAKMHCYGLDFGAGQKASSWAVEQGLAQGVTFHGSKPHGQLLRALSGADVLLHSSLEESFGVVLAEAMALGLPVVAGLHSGAVPWVVGDAALLVDVSSAEAMAAAMSRLFSESSTYQECSIRGRSRAQSEFSPAAVARAYSKCYSQILAGKRSRI